MWSVDTIGGPLAKPRSKAPQMQPFKRQTGPSSSFILTTSHVDLGPPQQKGSCPLVPCEALKRTPKKTNQQVPKPPARTAVERYTWQLLRAWLSDTVPEEQFPEDPRNPSKDHDSLGQQGVPALDAYRCLG